MHNKKILCFALLGILLFFFPVSGNAQAQLKVGDEAPSFTLPSTEDRLVDYYKDYYSFVCTQWRPMNVTYSREPFNDFEAFVHSFKFLGKGFYENFEDELNRTGL